MKNDFGGHRQHLYHAVHRYASALQTQNFREREYAGEFLDTVLATVIAAEIAKLAGPGLLGRAWEWVKDRGRVIERIFHEGGP